MKLQKIVERLQKLHPKEIDLSLDRIQNLCKKLDNPQDNLNCISVIGTNGKYSTIQTMRAILEEANINYNTYTSPHVQKINSILSILLKKNSAINSITDETSEDNRTLTKAAS